MPEMHDNELPLGRSHRLWPIPLSAIFSPVVLMIAVTFLPGLSQCDDQNCFSVDEQGNRSYFQCVVCTERDQEPCTQDSWQLPPGGTCEAAQQPVLEDGQPCELDGTPGECVSAVCEPLSPQSLTFTQTTIEESQAPWGKNLADVDGDGFLDILTAGGAQGVEIFWYAYPDWTKHRIAIYGGGDDLQVTDMNGDGAVDVIVNGWPIVWFENPRGSGGNPQAQWTGHAIDETYSHDVRIADIDRDGKLDVVAVKAHGTTVLYLQNSADSWSQTTLSNAHVTAGGLALADIDADGRIDVVGDGYWLRQPATPANGGAWQHRTIAAWGAGGSVDTADLNDDGRLDVLLAPSETGPGEIAWFEAPVDPLNGSWIRHTIADAEDVHLVHLVDFDNDHDLDIAFAEMHQSPTDRVGVYLNEGLGASWTLHLIATSASHNIAVGDLENDGDIDIVGANWELSSPDGGRLNWWRNDIGAGLVLSLDQ